MVQRHTVINTSRKNGKQALERRKSRNIFDFSVENLFISKKDFMHLRALIEPPFIFMKTVYRRVDSHRKRLFQSLKIINIYFYYKYDIKIHIYSFFHTYWSLPMWVKTSFSSLFISSCFSPPPKIKRFPESRAEFKITSLSL